MNGDLPRALAFAFRRKGASEMDRSKLLHLLAFDLRWFSPDPAKRLIQRALHTGLLQENGDKVRLAFDAESIDIPLNFRPSENLADEDGPVDVPTHRPPPNPRTPSPDPDTGGLPGARPLVDADHRAAAPDVEATAERARRGDLITLDVAALLLARRRGEDVREKARAAEARLLAG